MKDQELLERIVLDPGTMLGKPVIRGTRLTVEYILGLLAHGATETEILEEYQGLTKEDIQACLLLATGSDLARWLAGLEERGVLIRTRERAEGLGMVERRPGALDRFLNDRES